MQGMLANYMVSLLSHHNYCKWKLDWW